MPANIGGKGTVSNHSPNKYRCDIWQKENVHFVLGAGKMLTVDCDQARRKGARLDGVLERSEVDLWTAAVSV